MDADVGAGEWMALGASGMVDGGAAEAHHHAGLAVAAAGGGEGGVREMEV